MENRDWDILSAAREEARARTGARVYVLPPKLGDFRLDARHGEGISYREGGGLTARRENGRWFVDMEMLWYERAARAWNALPIRHAIGDDPDAYLCGCLLEECAAFALPIPEEMPLMRELMEAPHLLRTGKSAYRKQYARRCAVKLRHLRARALAEGRPLYALRGCAAALACLLA